MSFIFRALITFYCYSLVVGGIAVAVSDVAEDDVASHSIKK